jgi:hypothetical protein
MQMDGFGVIPSDPQTELVTLELAEFITEASFLSTWSLEEGTIPTRPSGLDSWKEVSYFSTLQQLLPSAVLIPDLDLLADLGPEIRDAVVAVLKDQTEPAAALISLLERIQAP